MRMPYPFKVPVDLADATVKVMVDMPTPANLHVHTCNDHALDARENLQFDHALAHVYGEFRPGHEHYHNRGEYF